MNAAAVRSVSPVESLEYVRAGEPLPARVARIKSRLLENVRRIDIERARFTTETYRATAGEPMPLRRAKMLLHLAQSQSIAIDDDELIVGNRSLLPRMGVIAPEGAVNWVDRELDTLPTRPQDPFEIDQATIDELRGDIFPYWRGQTLEDVVAARLPDDVRAAVAGKAFALNQTDHAQGHILPDVEGWLRLGIGGLRARVAAASARGGLTPSQQIHYAAAGIALEAAATLMRRYADLAAAQAEDAADPTRRVELHALADRCRHLAEEPARDFHEALQAVWFLFVLLQMESNASSFSPGRFDQY
ncbi:MAG: formate C-acetyltransferase, partial [Caldilineaceae bacterium]|nr:formate C-acetyltransferase [Caldilineaceae bacterium]